MNISFDAGAFFGALNRVRHAASTTQSHLQHVLCEIKDGCLFFVATDGHRLAVASIAVPADAPKTKFLVPCTMRAPKRADGIVTVAMSVDAAEIEFNGAITESVRDVGAFPNWKRLFPEPKESRVTEIGVNSRYIGEAAKAAGKICRIEFTGSELDPVRVIGIDYDEIIMPVRP